MIRERSQSGFTLIELMIVVAIVGILTTIAYPSYTDFVFRSNRAEAQSDLMRLASMQEQAFIDFRTYTDNMSRIGGNGDPHITESGNYSIDAVVSADGATFVLTATAQKAQLNDLKCPTFTITETGLQGPAGTAATCWER